MRVLLMGLVLELKVVRGRLVGVVGPLVDLVMVRGFEDSVTR